MNKRTDRRNYRNELSQTIMRTFMNTKPHETHKTPTWTFKIIKTRIFNINFKNPKYAIKHSRFHSTSHHTAGARQRINDQKKRRVQPSFRTLWLLDCCSQLLTLNAQNVLEIPRVPPYPLYTQQHAVAGMILLVFPVGPRPLPSYHIKALVWFCNRYSIFIFQTIHKTQFIDK